MAKIRSVPGVRWMLGGRGSQCTSVRWMLAVAEAVQRRRVIRTADLPCRAHQEDGRGHTRHHGTQTSTRNSVHLVFVWNSLLVVACASCATGTGCASHAESAWAPGCLYLQILSLEKRRGCHTHALAESESPERPPQHRRGRRYTKNTRVETRKLRNVTNVRQKPAAYIFSTRSPAVKAGRLSNSGGTILRYRCRRTKQRNWILHSAGGPPCSQQPCFRGPARRLKAVAAAGPAGQRRLEAIIGCRSPHSRAVHQCPCRNGSQQHRGQRRSQRRLVCQQHTSGNPRSAAISFGDGSQQRGHAKR